MAAPLVAAALSDKGTRTELITVAKKTTKWSLIVPAVIIGGVLVYAGGKAIYLNIARKKAAKLSEATNAANINAVIKDKVSEGLWYWLNPINSLVETTVNLPSNIVEGIFGKSGQDTAYATIMGLHVQDKKELVKAYRGLFNRNLSKDLKSALGDENFAKIDASWSITDIENTGYAVKNGTYKVKEGKQITKYTAGYYSEYSNKYAFVVKDGAGFYVNPSSSVSQLKPMLFKKGNYAGRSTGFKLAGKSFKGGIIFKDEKTNIVGIYLNAYVNNKNIIIIAPVKDTLLFDSLEDMNDYAYTKGIDITTMKV